MIERDIERIVDEFYLLLNQNKALASVVLEIWKLVGEGSDVDEILEDIMIKNGFAKIVPATIADEENEIEVGDPVLRLTDLGCKCLGIERTKE